MFNNVFVTNWRIDLFNKYIMNKYKNIQKLSKNVGTTWELLYTESITPHFNFLNINPSKLNETCL